MSFFQVIWFFLIGILLAGYAILDGFDLGIGFWYLLSRNDKDKKLIHNSIAPFWDGNEVWLLTGGGAIFAAFPHVYATVFSGFYLALMLVLFSLIFRAISIEFRNKVDVPEWTRIWDYGFAFGSILPTFLFGVALGNIMRGIPMDSNYNFTGTFFSLLNPYALLIGAVGFFMLITHGGLYLILKTDGELTDKVRSRVKKSYFLYLLHFFISGFVTITSQQHLLKNYKEYPVLWLVPIINLALIAAIGIFHFKGEAKKAFVSSSLSIAGMFGLIASGLFPYIVPALGIPDSGLTITNASSSELTLKVMFIVAIIGMPIVIGYTIWIYRLFGGKVKENQYEY
jgi:cytochrome bd ubiquinol oxidase subunit II